MKKIVKISGQLIIGALIGFFGMLVALQEDFRLDFSAYAPAINFIILAMGVLFFLFSIYRYFSIQNLTKQKLTGDEEDAAEGKMYRQYSDANLSSNLAMLLGLASLSLSSLTNQSLWLLIPGIFLLFSSFFMSFVIQNLIPKMYPNRELPSVSDKNYAKKLLEVSDDGERHIMLGGLYKTYLTMNSLLIGAVVLLLFYSIASESSQLFSIFIVISVLVITNTQYQISVRNK